MIALWGAYGEVTWTQSDSVIRCTWQLREREACANWICVWTNKVQPNSLLQKGISDLHVPLISQTPAISCLFRSSPCLLPFSPLPHSLCLSLIATVNKECAAFPQALKESLTLHSHNHFRPGCLGRHLHWDLPATRCRPNQTTEQRKFRKKKKKKIICNSETKECKSVGGVWPVWEHQGLVFWRLKVILLLQ